MNDHATNPILEQWLSHLTSLIDDVESWARELGWSTRRIEKSLKDSQVGPYRAPALLMQEGTTRILLEPIARSAPGAEGVVDLYLMPAYDDIASLYLEGGDWQLHYLFPGTPTVIPHRDTPAKRLSKESLQVVLDEMTKNAAQN